MRNEEDHMLLELLHAYDSTASEAERAPPRADELVAFAFDELDEEARAEMQIRLGRHPEAAQAVLDMRRGVELEPVDPAERIDDETWFGGKEEAWRQRLAERLAEASPEPDEPTAARVEEPPRPIPEPRTDPRPWALAAALALVCLGLSAWSLQLHRASTELRVTSGQEVLTLEGLTRSERGGVSAGPGLVLLLPVEDLPTAGADGALEAELRRAGEALWRGALAPNALGQVSVSILAEPVPPGVYELEIFGAPGTEPKVLRFEVREDP